MEKQNHGDTAPVDRLVMRRFWLFGGEQYYACGGCNDWRGSFDTVEAAVKHAREAPMFADCPKRGPIEWWHVFDSNLHYVVAWSDTFPYGAEKPPVFNA